MAATSRDDRSRVKTLLGHFGHPAYTLWTEDDPEERAKLEAGQISRLRIVTNSKEWDERTEVGIVDQSGDKGIRVKVDPKRNRAFVPSGYLQKLFESNSTHSPVTILSHLQFLMKKDSLGQDSFLIGPPGSFKRRIAMAFCELAGREVEFLSISQDTTVADIKQRREIKGGTALFADSCAVRAAIHGRVLILEGVEKAERNVLSTLNNLLENREMSLEDGRFLTNPVRFDAMMKDHGKEHLEKRWKDDDVRLVRVSDNFRVICLGVPVPEYEGNPLDPPFRSRFQSRDVKDDGEKRRGSEVPLIAKVHGAKLTLDAAALLSLDGVSTRALKRNSIPGDFERFLMDLISIFPRVLGRFAIACIFPIPHLPSTDPTHRHLMLEALERFGLIDDDKEGPYIDPVPSPSQRQQEQRNRLRDDQVQTTEMGASTPRTEYRDRVLGPRFTSRFGYVLDSLSRISREELLAAFVTTSEPKERVELPIQSRDVPRTSVTHKSSFVEGVTYHDDLVAQMIALYGLSQFHPSSTGGTSLFTLVGNRGSGKTCLIKRFAQLMNLNIVFFPLHRDMTSQDLFLRRATLANGDTIWTPSPLLTACENGDLLVLDSVEALAPSTLGTLSSLLTDREASLPDGTRIVANQASKRLPGDRAVHPNFRIVAVGRPAASDTGGRSRPAWLTSEVLSCFTPFLWVRSLSELEERQIVESLLPEAKQVQDVQRLLVLGQYLRTREDEESRSLSLSTRQLIRISRRICAVHKEGKSELAALIQHSCLWRFLPSIARTALEAAMTSCDISMDVENYYQQDVSMPPPQLTMFRSKRPFASGHRSMIGELQIGDVVCPVLEPKDEHEKSLIPDTYFVENPRQTRILKGMLQDYLLGSHLLLLGNQGTGKNKLVDRLLHLLHLPREYIQLDRDTTVNALTSQPVVEDGVVRYEDSPLVKAARFGRILVVDEADKAPTHVTAILKSLLADGEMLLSDGRRLVSSSMVLDGLKKSSDTDEIIVVHEDFRAIVLANRPGYPFLGNDLFRETGDIFAPHVVDNPDEESELALLKEYAPHVPEETLRKLTVAFQDLRGLVNDGKLLYPYSTRELVNAVKHMEKFPRDGLAVTLQNVFDFDRYAVEDRKTISVLFDRHGIPVSLSSKYKVKTGDVTPLPEPVLSEIWKPSLAKHGPVIKLNYVIHALGWKSAQQTDTSGAVIKSFNLFPLTLAAQKVPLVRHEGRASVFEEQLFSFSLPTAEFTGHGVGVVGACAMKDFSFVVAANDAYNALRLYWIKSPTSLREFDVFDVSIPHFNFRDEFIPQVRRPAPSRCTMFAMPKEGQIGMFSHDDQTLFVMDLIQKHFKLLALDPAVFRIQQAAATNVPVGLYAERMRTIVCTDLCAEFGVVVVYQQLSNVVLLYDLVGDVRITLVLPFPVDILDSTSPFSFLIRSAINGKTYVLRATGAETRSSTPDTASSSVVVAGTVRSGIVYTAFHILPVDQNRIGVQADEGVSTLHGQYSFIAPHPMHSATEIKLNATAVEKRFLRSSGTVCQVLESFSQVFLRQPAQPDVIVDGTQEALLRSYLRTNLTKATSESIVAAGPLSIRGTNMMASLFVRRKKFIHPVGVGRLDVNSGYFGFDTTALLEVVDLQKNTLRVVQVSLPETSRRSGSAVLSERFDPDGVQVHDEEEEEAAQAIAQDDSLFMNNDESNTSGLRQRAPFLFCFQTIQGDVLTLDRTGIGRVFQVDQDKLDKALESWKSMVGDKANSDDIDFDDGEDQDGSDEEDSDEADDGDEVDDEDEDEADDDTENDEADEYDEASQEHDDDQDGDQQPGAKAGGKGKRAKGKKGARGKTKRGRKGGKGGKSGAGRARSGGSSRRNGGGRSQRRGGQGNGQGQGQGSGGGGGAGSGGEGEGDLSLPEPGQFRGSRPLSARDREIAQARLEELRRLTRYFPNDERIRGEMESLEERLEEADEAERLSRENDDASAAAKQRIASLKQRLERIEAEIARNRSSGKSTVRLEAEAQQIRQLINRLEQGIGGQGLGEDGEGEGSGGSRSKGQQRRKEREMDEQARKQAKKLEKEAWKEVLESLDANPQDAALYQRYKDSVASEIRELRATLDQMHAKKNERVWLRNKDVGDLDDRRLVDGLTGERNIYKRRGERPPDPFAFQDHPKRLTFLFDVSSSMSRYSMDGRLERSLEAATMAMEAFKGYEHKFAWKFRGHSGSTDDVVFVEPGKYPKDDAGRLDVLRRMNAHAETCGSGDNTLEATKLAIREITKDEGDEYFCILFSDANIEQYSIKPADLKALLDQDERVNVFIVFIGSMGQQAQRLRAELPQDRVFVTLSTSQIPAVLKKIFLSSVLKE